MSGAWQSGITAARKSTISLSYLPKTHLMVFSSKLSLVNLEISRWRCFLRLSVPGTVLSLKKHKGGVQNVRITSQNTETPCVLVIKAARGKVVSRKKNRPETSMLWKLVCVESGFPL